MISKTEAARRQLETAIDLYFNDADSLSVHTLAFAVFKVLMDIYPHHQDDGFAAQLDDLMGKEGWKSMAGVANFLKHADRDHDAFLNRHHPAQAMSIIGLATLLYRRVAGEMTLKMMAFDSWTEELGYEELGIEEIDEDEARVEQHRQIREMLRSLPHEQMIVFARLRYNNFLADFERINKVVMDAQSEGKSFTQTFEEIIAKRRAAATGGGAEGASEAE